MMESNYNQSLLWSDDKRVEMLWIPPINQISEHYLATGGHRLFQLCAIFKGGV